MGEKYKTTRGLEGWQVRLRGKIGKYRSIVNMMKIWLKIETPNDMPTFAIGCYNPPQYSNFCACFDKDQIFANLEIIAC